MPAVDQIRERLPEDAQDRVNKAVRDFREINKDPASLALNAVGYYSIFKGVVRFLFRGKRLRGLVFIAAGIGLIGVGREIEGSDPFTDQGGTGSRGNGQPS
jgi:hypothetical protein